MKIVCIPWLKITEIAYLISEGQKPMSYSCPYINKKIMIKATNVQMLKLYF
jgi:hypothetical protein